MIPKRTDMQLSVEARQFRERMLRDRNIPTPSKDQKPPITKATTPLQPKP